MFLRTALLPLRRLWPALAYGLHRLAPSHYWLVGLRADYFGCAALAHALYVLVWLAQPAQAHLPPLLSCVGGSSHGAFFSPAEAGDYFRRLLVRLGIRVAYVALHFWPDGRLDFHLCAPSHDRGVALRRTAAAVRQFCRAAARQTTGELNRARLRWGLHTVANFSPAGFVFFLDELPGELLLRADCRHAPAPVKAVAEPDAVPRLTRAAPERSVAELLRAHEAPVTKPAPTLTAPSPALPRLWPVQPAGPTAPAKARARRRRPAQGSADVRPLAYLHAPGQLDLFALEDTATAARPCPPVALASATPANPAPSVPVPPPDTNLVFGFWLSEPPVPALASKPGATPIAPPEGAPSEPVAATDPAPPSLPPPPVRPARLASELLAHAEPFDPRTEIRCDWARCIATLVQHGDRLAAEYGDRWPDTLGALQDRARAQSVTDSDAVELSEVCGALLALMVERQLAIARAQERDDDPEIDLA